MKLNNQTRLLAELTEILAPAKSVEVNDTNVMLREILARLDKLENQLALNQAVTAKPTYSLHPSQQKFQIAEVNEILLPQTSEKACRFEPDKPCDYCLMCSAHGF